MQITTETTGQQVAKLLTLVGAMVGGIQIQTGNYAEPVEVLAILRDNWTDAPIFVRLATTEGAKQLLLDEIEI